MKRWLTIFILLLVLQNSRAQNNYVDSMLSYISNYVATHEVVKEDEKKLMQFYPVDESFKVVAVVKPAKNSQWIKFKTSGIKEKVYKLYGTLHFTLHDRSLALEVYQSQDLMMNPQYRDYLFLAFTDATTGPETYEGGRYIDLRTGDIRNNTIVIDFNKAYNPYCAYVSGVYNCPVPPANNSLPVAITAGEKIFVRQ